MRRMDLRILIQATGDNPISLRRKHVMENFIGPNPTSWRGLIEPLVVIRYDLSLADHQVSMMAWLIAPGKACRACGGLGRKGCLQSNRLASAQMRQNKMQLAGSAGREAGAGPLGLNHFAISAGKRNRR